MRIVSKTRKTMPIASVDYGDVCEYKGAILMRIKIPTAIEKPPANAALFADLKDGSLMWLSMSNEYAYSPDVTLYVARENAGGNNEDNG